LATRLSVKQKNEIIEEFSNGKTIEKLAIKFNCTKQTISRNLKKNLGEKKYNELISNVKSKRKTLNNKKINMIYKAQNEINVEGENDVNTYKNTFNNKLEENNNFNNSSFYEIIPLIDDIDNAPQKDLVSSSIAEVDFPKVVYMIVNKEIELEIKYLKEYPEWGFLSEKDLNRKTIEIFFDLKNAKSKCIRNNKVIKVPNTKVFKIVAPILISRGITRIISEDQLISL